MIRIDDWDDAYAISTALSVAYSPSLCHCFALWRNGELKAGCLFTDYTRAAIQMHIVGFKRGWLDRTFLWVCFDYPFNQLGVHRVFGRMDGANRQVLDFTRKLGFTEVARIPGVYPYPPGDLVIASMPRSRCRWLDLRQGDGVPDGWQVRSSASA